MRKVRTIAKTPRTSKKKKEALRKTNNYECLKLYMVIGALLGLFLVFIYASFMRGGC